MNTYSIWAIVEIDATVNIEAESFEDALQRAKSLKETDFVKPLSNYNDGTLKIRGIFDEQVCMNH